MVRDSARRVLQIESEAIQRLIGRIDSTFERAVEMLYACSGRVVVTGIGKSGLVCRKIAATLASTGTPALFLHPTEAIHGDIGMVVAEDLVLAVSNSGATEELVRLVEVLKRLGVPLIALLGNPDSTLAKNSDLILDISIEQEACPLGLAPTASTTAAIAMGDALAMALSVRRGFNEEDFASLHPGGKLGKKLRRVKDLMHTGNEMPLVHLKTSMKQVIYEISKKGLGMTAVVDATSRVAGIITDGDLRRLLQEEEKALEKTAGECMHSPAVCIGADVLAMTALAIMEDKKITALIVNSEGGQIKGVLHLHNLWQV